MENKNITDFVSQLTAKTLEKLQQSRGHSANLVAAVETFYTAAVSAGIAVDEMEDILGVNESSIMDLAALSEIDEEIVMETFEKLTANQAQ